MTRMEKIKLVNDLIREDRESTVRTYLDCVKEIERIELVTVDIPVKPIDKINNLTRVLLSERRARA